MRIVIVAFVINVKNANILKNVNPRNAINVKNQRNPKNVNVKKMNLIKM
jgi:hypothetical protein